MCITSTIRNAIKYDQCKNVYSSLIFILIVVILSSITIIRFYPDDSFKLGYDTLFHLKRFQSISTAIHNHTFPFYIDVETMNGYGYAENLFYPDIFLVPFALIIKSVGLVNSYKLMLFFSFVSCAVICYISIWQIFKSNKISAISSLLYTFSLYHLIIWGARNALGEIVACTFFPIVVWGFYEIIFGNYRKRWYIIGIAFTCLILSHLLSSFIAFWVLLVFVLINVKMFLSQPKRFLYLIYAGILCILLSSFFLFPFAEQSMDNEFYYQVHPLFPSLTEWAIPLRRILFGMFSGFTFSELDITSIGITLILPLFLRFFISSKSRITVFADVSLIIGLVLILLMADFFPWDSFPFNLFTIIQLPFRFLSISSLLLAISGGIYIYILVPNNINFTAVYIATTLGIFILIFSASGMFYRIPTIAIDNENPNLQTFNMGGNEYLSSRVPRLNILYPTADYIGIRGNNTIETNQCANISNIERKQSRFYFDIRTNQETEAILPLLYYKGYKATLNGQDLKLNQSDDGLVQISIPSSGKVVVWFDGTMIQRISLVVSILTFITLVIYITLTRKKRKHHE